MDESKLENYNLRSPAVKRILREAKELTDATYEYYARPLEDNLFEWHFTVRGAADSDFADGYYHGRIILPTEYPMKPPSIIMLTPNGRFELNQKICLNISGHHPETWIPSWSIRTALLAIISFMPTNPKGHLGAVYYPPEERRKLAQKSHHWKCDRCGLIRDHLKPAPETVAVGGSQNIPAPVPENLSPEPSPAPVETPAATTVEPLPEQQQQQQQQEAATGGFKNPTILLSIAATIFALLLRRLLMAYL